MNLNTSFTSTGEKLFHHQQAMQALRDGSGKPIHAWLAAHDLCNHRCTFCSVGERAGDTLSFTRIQKYFTTLAELGLKAVTLSGGGNSILYKCKETGADFNDLVAFLHALGLQIGVITNGMPMKEYIWKARAERNSEGEFKITHEYSRKSWKSVHPSTLDKMTWCRISMSGLDHNHKEQEVFVPDFDPTKTTLGFSWIMSDSYEEPSHKHGWVSTPEDIKTEMENRKVVYGVDRLPWIEEQMKGYVEKHNPAYVRLLCNCLQPDQIPERHRMLSEMAQRIDPTRVFSQNKPPRQPSKCWKVLPHPCLNADGWVYPCDSVVLNKMANHQFGSTWRICTAEQIGELYADPSKFDMPDGICPGCVFADQVDLINNIVGGMETPLPPAVPQHVNFV
jgi:MoaA/NifB/PqqE/SkfB family radical SAM enzyme